MHAEGPGFKSQCVQILFPHCCLHLLRNCNSSPANRRPGNDKYESTYVGLKANALTAVGFEPTPFRTGALSQRLRPLGQTVLRDRIGMKASKARGARLWKFVGCVVSCGCLVWHLWCSGACFAGYLWLRFPFFEWACLWFPFGLGWVGRGWEFPLAWGLGGGGVGRRGLSVPRLPRASRKRAGSHASVLYRAFLPSCLNSSAELPGLLPLPGPIPKSKCAVVDTKEDRSACQVIPKVGVVTLLGCHKPGANLHQPGIELGSHRWQRCILPLDH